MTCLQKLATLEQVSLRNVRSMQVNREDVDFDLGARLKKIEDGMKDMLHKVESKGQEWTKVCTWFNGVRDIQLNERLAML